MLDGASTGLDETDRRLIAGLRGPERASLSDLARQAGVARGTVYARIERMERTGVITGYGPDIDPVPAGYGVTAFCTLEISQGAHGRITAAIATIDEVIEIHTVTGPGDLLCRIVARSNDHLHEILQAVTALPGIERSQTQLALHTSHRRTVADLVSSPADEGRP